MDEPIPLQDAATRFEVRITRLRKAADEGRLAVQRLSGSRERLVRPSEVRRFLKDGGQAKQPTTVAPQPVQQASAADGRARVIAVAIPKGGTGKTTTTANLGAALAAMGQRVLLIDLDPQGSLTITLDRRPTLGQPTVYEVILRYVNDYERTLAEAIVDVRPNLALVPATPRLNRANAQLVSAPRGEYVLRQVIEPLRARYDVILIDTLPYLGILVDNALAAADEVLIPTQAQHLSTESIELIAEQVKTTCRSELNPALRITGILLTQVQENRVVDRGYREGIRSAYAGDIPVFQTVIKYSADVQKSQAMQPPQTILEFAPHSSAALAYRALAEEVLHGAAVTV
jgi:chromosome partitioning protein